MWPPALWTTKYQVHWWGHIHTRSLTWSSGKFVHWFLDWMLHCFFFTKKIWRSTERKIPWIFQGLRCKICWDLWQTLNELKFMLKYACMHVCVKLVIYNAVWTVKLVSIWRYDLWRFHSIVHFRNIGTCQIGYSFLQIRSKQIFSVW